MKDTELLNSTLQAQAEQREQLIKERTATKSAYIEIKDSAALKDLRKFIEAQIQGCKDKASTTDNAHVCEKHLHMSLMASIIKEYIDNQTII